ncbi:RNA cap guanine-N2 methyltransferase-domain-containing protein [Kockovaella imperatae]|uniref:Trimethylguanosine synthase n=1 Tax=Kockovaella imperatae TaxID=4999 RepID=A0A1Y1UIH2_9TREE|nr:RNA cap guanine-N2 methyltransferase-domain-containing protein [Kockovaella imperatae]ORX37789.1 RNA cap guanine-N2 methyltransferase-domain-containing protein [Kockovaella imperatae]
MPRANKQSRSLFRSLPYNLKQSIRSKEGDTLTALAGVGADGLLRTQPDSSSENGDTTLADVTVNIDFHNEEIGSSSTPLRLVHTSGVSSGTLESTVNSSKRKRKSRGAQDEILNQHLGHPWDCTGLVDRYTTASQVPAELVKYWYQRQFLLPQYDSLPLLLDDTGWFSITPQPIAAHIAERCQCDVIVDAFCGVGGNAIEFAKTCERVIAIDNNPIRLRLARHNALHLGVADRIDFILGDFVDYARSWRAQGETIDVVFLSPPWGGVDYLQSGQDTGVDPSYSLSSILPVHGKELFDMSAKLSPNIAYYLPRSTDIAELSQLAPGLSSVQQGRKKEWVEIEEEWVGQKLKAITAYFGSLVATE